MSQYLFDLSDKVVVVPGSARGLGKAIAKGLANAGARVIIFLASQASSYVTGSTL